MLCWIVAQFLGVVSLGAGDGGHGALYDKIDNGGILGQVRVMIPQGITMFELIKRTKKAGGELVAQVIQTFQHGTIEVKDNLSEGGPRFSWPTIEQMSIPASFFVVGELVPSMKVLLREFTAEGHDLGVHGWDHSRPMTLTVERFAGDLGRAKQVLEDVTGVPVHGYRAPCFSLYRDRFDSVRAAGLTYDSSRIIFEGYPLYGTLDLHDFTALSPNIFRQDDFFEFQISSLPVGGRHVPVSGGGYIRIFPWFMMSRLISR